jgi:hypothetical protein
MRYLARKLFKTLPFFNLVSFSSSSFFFINYSAKFTITNCSTTINGHSSIEK